VPLDTPDVKQVIGYACCDGNWSCRPFLKAVWLPLPVDGKTTTTTLSQDTEKTRIATLVVEISYTGD